MTAKIDKFALAKRFLKLGQQEQEKFISLLAQKGISFEKLPIVAGEEGLSSPLSPVQQGIWDIYHAFQSPSYTVFRKCLQNNKKGRRL